MYTVFWDKKCCPRGETINTTRSCDILRTLRRAIQITLREMLSKRIVLLLDNTCPRDASDTQSLIQQVS